MVSGTGAAGWPMAPCSPWCLPQHCLYQGTQWAQDLPRKAIWTQPPSFVFIWATIWMWQLGLRVRKWAWSFFLFYHYRVDPKSTKLNPSLSPRQEGSYYYLITALFLLLFHAPALLGLCARGLPMDCSCNSRVWSIMVCHHHPPVTPFTLLVFSPVTPAWPVPTSCSSFVGKKFTLPDFAGPGRKEQKGNEVTRISSEKKKNVSCQEPCSQNLKEMLPCFPQPPAYVILKLIQGLIDEKWWKHDAVQMGGAGVTWRWTHKVTQVYRWSPVTLDHLKVRAGLKLALPHPVGPRSYRCNPWQTWAWKTWR